MTHANSSSESLLGLQHWDVQIDRQQILWVGLDVQGEKYNLLSQAVMQEFSEILRYVQQAPPQAIIVFSKKTNGFVAGADIKEFAALDTIKKAHAYIMAAQDLFQAWSELPCVTVAMLRGVCLGGGCELALACDYRVAERSMQTRIGLPEVQLGIMPGWGGSVRLVRRLGVRRALPLLLSGRMLSARAAQKVGLIDAGVPVAQLRAAAIYYARSASLNARQRRSLQCTPGIVDSILSFCVVRPLLAAWIRRSVRRKVSPQHYPAPFAIIRNWQRHGAKGKRAFVAEAATVVSLVQHPTSRHLVRVFFLRQQLQAQAAQQPSEIQHVHVIGAGVMGGDIAAWCASRGMRVTLQDVSLEAMQPAYRRALAWFKKKLPYPYLQQRVSDRFILDPDGHGIARADLIIEAVLEDMQIKLDILREVEAQCQERAIIASNTSSLSLEEMAQGLQRPERLCGLHFFNPVQQLPLVEVIANPATDAEVLQRLLSFVKQIKKLPLPVKNCPGFLVNRILMPYLLEAVHLLVDGHSPLRIDAAARDLGMPVGPIRLADQVGLDICLAVANNLLADEAQQTSSAKPGALELLQQLVDAEQLGVKTTVGFYRYKQLRHNKARATAAARVKKLQGINPSVASLMQAKSAGKHGEIAERLWMRLLNESVACWREKVVASPGQLDAGLIFGCGFPAFTGGALLYIEEHGVAACVQRLKILQQQHGARFTPDVGWQMPDLQQSLTDD